MFKKLLKSLFKSFDPALIEMYGEIDYVIHFLDGRPWLVNDVRRGHVFRENGKIRYCDNGDNLHVVSEQYCELVRKNSTIKFVK